MLGGREYKVPVSCKGFLRYNYAEDGWNSELKGFQSVVSQVDSMVGLTEFRRDLQELADRLRKTGRCNVNG